MDPSSAADLAAVDRHHAFEFWEVSPLVNGTYNPTMRATLGSRLPSFTPAETAKLAGSYDFVAFDAYTSTWIAALNASDAAACPESARCVRRAPTAARRANKPAPNMAVAAAVNSKIAVSACPRCLSSSLFIA